jgi:hypothetical protein
MANAEWVEIYSAYTPAELSEEQAKLKKQAGVFTAQSSGGKSYTKDLAEIRGRLASIQRVLNARAAQGQPNPLVGVTDFRNV